MSDSKKKKALKPTNTQTSFKALETVQFERLLADISARFINLSSEEVNKAITESLECVSQTLGVDRCTLLEFHEDLSVEPNFFCYNAPGIKTVTAAGPPSPDSYLIKMMREGKTICFNRLDELPQEAMVDLEYLQSRGVKSMFFIPVKSKNSTVCVLALSGIRSEYRWPEKLKPRLRLLAEVFTRVLKQKQTEDAILREKQFTETAINGLPGIFYVYDSDWRLVRWNRNHELLTGFSADELKGRMVLDWFPEDFKEIIATAVSKVFNEGEIMVEAPLLIKDGSQVPYLFKGNRLEVAGEVYLMGMGIDVSERKAKVEAILREKQFTEAAINGLPGIFYVYDSDWKMVRWNRNHELLTGFSADELKERKLLDWFPEDFKEAVTNAVRKVFDKGEAMVEAPLLIKGGGQVPYLFKGNRLEVAGKVYLMGMGIDISDRKAKEEALCQSEQQLRLITDSLPALIAQVDSSQRYIFVNESYAKYVGQPRNEIHGKHLREVLSEDIYEKIHKNVETVLSGEPVTFDIQISSTASGPRHLLIMYVPDFKGDTVQGFFASIHDVTDFEKAKKEARVAHEALYHVGRVTMLEALSSSLSHEIQQPLTGILSNAQAAEVLINRPKPDMDEIQAIIKDIVADTKRAGGIIWQLRAFLRKQKTNLQILNLNQLIEDVLSMLNSDMVIHNVMIEKDFAADLPQVVGDSVQLKQVLINLIVNAEQVMEDSASGLHRLVLHTLVGSKGEIIVAIEDSGPGIEEGLLKKIFEPFYTTRQEGTGMGLAISQFIIESHNGRIWAENQTEQGAKICFSLPAEGSPES